MKVDYELMRRTRPDGNCFFRAFAFAYFESLLDDLTELERFSRVATKTKDDLIKLGVLAFTVEDFHDNVRLFNPFIIDSKFRSFKPFWTRFAPRKSQILNSYSTFSMIQGHRII